MNVKHCPKCRTSGKCFNSRPTQDYVRRRYECRKCGTRWTTVELFVEQGRGLNPDKIELFRQRMKRDELVKVLARVHATLRQEFLEGGVR